MPFSLSSFLWCILVFNRDDFLINRYSKTLFVHNTQGYTWAGNADDDHQKMLQLLLLFLLRVYSKPLQVLLHINGECKKAILQISFHTKLFRHGNPFGCLVFTLLSRWTIQMSLSVVATIIEPWNKVILIRILY